MRARTALVFVEGRPDHPEATAHEGVGEEHHASWREVDQHKAQHSCTNGGDVRKKTNMDGIGRFQSCLKLLSQESIELLYGFYMNPKMDTYKEYFLKIMWKTTKGEVWHTGNMFTWYFKGVFGYLGGNYVVLAERNLIKPSWQQTKTL